jgi:hypothetical protein
MLKYKLREKKIKIILVNIMISKLHNSHIII